MGFVIWNGSFFEEYCELEQKMRRNRDLERKTSASIRMENLLEP